MSEAMDRPRRKRLSWESRCEIVALIEAGVSPAVAAARGGASRATGYRPPIRRDQQLTTALEFCAVAALEK